MSYWPRPVAWCVIFQGHTYAASACEVQRAHAEKSGWLVELPGGQITLMDTLWRSEGEARAEADRSNALEALAQ